MRRATADEVMRFASERGVITRGDLVERGINPDHLGRLARSGDLIHVGRGTYESVAAPISEHHGLVTVARMYPQATVCLLSALSFHDLTTQVPFQTWMAIEGKARRPASSGPPVRWIRYSGVSLTAGVEVHELEGIAVRVFSAAKTVADCFKFRNAVGLDVAMEALRDYLRQASDIDELWRHALTDRVARVMLPYLETVTA